MIKTVRCAKMLKDSCWCFVRAVNSRSGIIVRRRHCVVGTKRVNVNISGLDAHARRMSSGAYRPKTALVEGAATASIVSTLVTRRDERVWTARQGRPQTETPRGQQRSNEHTVFFYFFFGSLAGETIAEPPSIARPDPRQRVSLFLDHRELSPPTGLDPSSSFGPSYPDPPILSVIALLSIERSSRLSDTRYPTFDNRLKGYL